MKSLVVILTITLLLAPLSVQAASSKIYINEHINKQEQEIQSWEKSGGFILKALDHFEQSEPSEGTALLIDAVLIYHPEIDFEGTEEKLLSAKKHFLNDDYAKGSKEVTAALKIIKEASGIDSVKPIEKDVTIAEAVKDLLLQSIEEFRLGNPAHGIIGILEALVLITGPKG